MNIKDALQIIFDGKNKHFDEEIVNKFLKISTYEILQVMLETENVEINQTEEILLKEFNLEQLYAILNSSSESISKKQKKLINVFDKYYHYNTKEG